MKVAFLVGTFPVVAETFILNQAVGLLERGHEVSIFALDGPPLPDALAHPDVERHRLAERTRHAPTTPRGYLPRLKTAVRLLARRGSPRRPQLLALSPAVLGRRALSLKPLFAAQPLLDAAPFDVVHAQFGFVGVKAVAMRRIGLLRGAPLVTSLRGADVTRWPREAGPGVYRELFRTGELFLPVSDRLREQAVALGCPAEKIVTHRSGIDLSRFAFRPRQPPAGGPLRLASVGRIVERKGFEHGVRAVATLVRERRRDVTYRIVGDGPLRERLSRLAADLGVGDRVAITGFAPQPDVLAALEESHVFLAPSVTTRRGEEEGVANALKEAMAAGLPVVATRHGGTAELVEHGVSGLLVPERDPDALADAVEGLLAAPDAWPELARAGRHAVEDGYDRERLNDELVELYGRALAPLAPQGRRLARGDRAG